MSDPSVIRRHHISQEDSVILVEEKYERIYKPKEENSVQDGVSRISLKGSSL